MTGTNVTVYANETRLRKLLKIAEQNGTDIKDALGNLIDNASIDSPNSSSSSLPANSNGGPSTSANRSSAVDTGASAKKNEQSVKLQSTSERSDRHFRLGGST